MSAMLSNYNSKWMGHHLAALRYSRCLMYRSSDWSRVQRMYHSPCKMLAVVQRFKPL
jgi:hypothetical protein